MGRINSFGIRILLIQSLFALLIITIVGRLYVVQIVKGEEFEKIAARQYVERPGATFNRGSIFFTTKQGKPFSAASLIVGSTIAIRPDHIVNKEKTYQQLSSFLEIDREIFMARASKVGDPYEEIARKVPQDTAREISKLNLPGVSIHEEKWRYYPGGSLAAQTLGFVSYADGILQGTYGVERFREQILATPTTRLYVNFFAEVFTGLKQVIDKDSRTGDVHLTIEPTVQMSLEKILGTTQKKWNSKRVSGIVINPQTGEIYALGSNPSFDLNSFRFVEDASVYANPLVSGVFEMGSIIKPLTLAAGIDAGTITANSTFNDTGTITLDGKRISNYDGMARGVVDMQTVLSKSLNTGVSHVVTQMGTRKFAQYLEGFGIRELSGIDLPHEAKGLTANLDSPRKVEFATASFGQGVAFNPMVTVRALSVLGNGGYLITPYITKKIDYEMGGIEEVAHAKGERVISEKSSEEITRMLIRVVDEALVGGEASLARWTIAAKTGTAQIAGPGGRYLEDKYLHTFFGYFPAYEPRFLVFLMNEEPQGAEYASQTLTEPFRELTKFLLNYYEIPPDR